MANVNAEPRRQKLSAEGTVCSGSRARRPEVLEVRMVRQSRAGVLRAALSIVRRSLRFTPLSNSDGDGGGRKTNHSDHDFPDRVLPGQRMILPWRLRPAIASKRVVCNMLVTDCTDS